MIVSIVCACVCVYKSLSVRLRLISEECDVIFGLQPLLCCLFCGDLLKC